MDRFLTKIVKLQNQILLEKLCEKYGLDKKEIMARYHTPTFYQVTPLKKDMYHLEWK
jgi:hypothetical protein